MGTKQTDRQTGRRTNCSIT